LEISGPDEEDSTYFYMCDGVSFIQHQCPDPDNLSFDYANNECAWNYEFDDFDDNRFKYNAGDKLNRWITYPHDKFVQDFS
jgi:hypothetical protein